MYVSAITIHSIMHHTQTQVIMVLYGRARINLYIIYKTNTQKENVYCEYWRIYMFSVSLDIRNPKTHYYMNGLIIARENVVFIYTLCNAAASGCCDAVIVLAKMSTKFVPLVNTFQIHLRMD